MSANFESRDILGRISIALENASRPAWVDAHSMFVNTDKSFEEYKWLGMAPTVSKWEGERQINGLRSEGTLIKNEKFESTLEVLVDELRRDRLNQIEIRIADLARRMGEHWADLTVDLIEANGACYDGVSFFSASHEEENSGVQSNDIAADVSVTTPETMQKAIIKGVKQLMSLKDDKGTILHRGANQFAILCPLDLMDEMSVALNNDLIVSGAGGNAVADSRLGSMPFGFQSYIEPRLVSGSDIYLTRIDTAQRGIILQEEVAPQVQAIAEGSEEEFLHDRHLYGVKAIRGVGFGLWQNMVKIDCS